MKLLMEKVNQLIEKKPAFNLKKFCGKIQFDDEIYE